MKDSLKKATIEQKLLFLLSRVSPDDEAIKRAGDIIKKGLNWAAFVDLCITNSTANIVYKNLLKLHPVPKEIVERFSKIYFGTLHSNILQINELDRLLEECYKEGIEIITLKGASVSEIIFRDIGLYPSSDIDFLFKSEDFDKLNAVFERNGYRLIDEHLPRYKDYYLKEQYHCVFSNGTFTFEPHWNLFFRYFNAPPDFWWSEALLVESNGRKYWYLSPEKNILYLSFRIFSKGFNSLKFLAIISETVNYYNDIMDWKKLFLYAKRYRFQNVLYAVLMMCRDFLGADITPEISSLRNLRADMLYKKASDLILNPEPARNPIIKVWLTLIAINLQSSLKILLKRLFPPVAEVRIRYHIYDSSSKIYIYYLLNPLLLILRKHQK
jgi:hypothetical protein